MVEEDKEVKGPNAIITKLASLRLLVDTVIKVRAQLERQVGQQDRQDVTETVEYNTFFGGWG